MGLPLQTVAVKMRSIGWVWMIYKGERLPLVDN